MKAKIIIASTLKPIDDVRSYEKIAVSLESTGQYQIHLVVQIGRTKMIAGSFQTHFLPAVKRLSIQRFFSPLRYYKTYLQVKPHLIIINTHDLLIVTVLYKIIFGAKLIYDIQENYKLNILHQNNYFKLIKPFLAYYVRAKEYFMAPFLDVVFFAEKTYSRQMDFIKKKAVTLENKYLPVKGIGLRISTEHAGDNFLICGTLASEYGLFEGISFFRQLLPYFSNCQLSIVGHCPRNKTKVELDHLAMECSEIRLQISTSPLSHTTILKYMINSNFVVLPYQDNKSINNRIPTKLFECLALHIPVVISRKDDWGALVADNKAGISINFNEPLVDPAHIAQVLKQSTFYMGKTNPDLFWQKEEPKLLDTVANLLQQ